MFTAVTTGILLLIIHMRMELILLFPYKILFIDAAVISKTYDILIYDKATLGKNTNGS